MADVFNAIDPRIFHRLDTNMWRTAATYLPAAEIAQLARCCRYFNEQVVWHPHSARILWAEVPQRDLNKILCHDLPLSHLQTLIDAADNVDATVDNYMTALMCASYRGRADNVRAFLAAGANANATDRMGNTALIIACRRTNDADIVRALLSAGANMDASDVFGDTALLTSIINGHVDMARALLMAGCDPNGLDTYGGITPLMYASWRRGKQDIVIALMAAGANVNAVSRFGSTALSYAMNEHVIATLIKAGAQHRA
jgi:ankyrin repeat protein